jgi:MFS family permease
MTDRVQRRKPLASAGYFLTAIGVSLIGFSTHWIQVLLCRLAAWVGRGSRGPARDVLMAEAVAPESAGKAFGLERAGDALGAVIGPLIAFWFVSHGIDPRHIMVWSFVPGILAFLTITLLVVEKPFTRHAPARSFRDLLKGTSAKFKSYLGGIFLFGCGDFSRTLLIFYTAQHVAGSLFSWTGSTLAVALYVLHNAVSTGAALPIGALSDRVGRRPILIIGYGFAAMVTFGFAFLSPTPIVLIMLFIGSGMYIACEEVCEKAYASELLAPEIKGTGMGLLASINGVADMISSALVGALWALFPNRPVYGFFLAASLQLGGAVRLIRLKNL